MVSRDMTDYINFHHSIHIPQVKSFQLAQKLLHLRMMLVLVVDEKVHISFLHPKHKSISKHFCYSFLSQETTNLLQYLGKLNVLD